ncbi:UbiD family decarboxylase [Sorangium sp. So ce1128]
MQLAKLFVVSEELDPDLGITRFISEWVARYGAYPTFVFSRIRDTPRFKVVMNLLKREILLGAMRCPERGYLAELAERFASRRGEVRTARSLATEPLEDMSQLPILRHQPGDAGKYLTSAIGCLYNAEYSVFNLGFYRVHVKDPRRGAIFMDPRTDAFRIVQAARQAGRREVPITLFLGGPLSTYVAGAFRVPYERDSYEAAASLGGAPLSLSEDAGDYPPAPSTAEIVIHGRIQTELDDEAPFGEFKGYYCAPTRSPVLLIDAVRCRPDPHYLGIFCGKESGLTLMSLGNEVFMLAHLRDLGHQVEDVRYPLDTFGEFVALIQTRSPSQEVLDAAFAADRRVKAVVVAEDIHRVLGELSIFDFHVHTQSYEKRGQRRGDRVGVVVKRNEEYQWVEY